MKQNFLAIMFDGNISLVSRRNNSNIYYWYGSEGYFYSQEVEILENFGWIDDMEDWKLDIVELDFLQKYNIPEATKPIPHAGWISPFGTFYKCEYFEHTSLAKSLCAIHYNCLNDDRLLIEENWIRVCSSGALEVKNWDGKFTQQQYDCVYDVLQSSNDSEGFKNNLEIAFSLMEVG